MEANALIVIHCGGDRVLRAKLQKKKKQKDVLVRKSDEENDGNNCAARIPYKP